MAQLSYKGAALSTGLDVAHRPFPATLKNSDLSTAQVNALIDARFSNYPSSATIRALDDLLATTGFIDAQDSTKMLAEIRGAPGGVAPLDNTGKIPVTYFPVGSTQSWNGIPAIPIAYNLDPQLVTGGTTELYTCLVPDPGYPYRVLVFGQVDATSTNDYTYPTATVRLGSSTGTVIAQGMGAADGVVSLKMGDDFERDNNNTLGERWNVTYIGEGTTSMAIRSNEASLLQATAPNNKTVASVCQMVDPAVRYTGTNYQKIAFKVGTRAGSPAIDTPKQGNPYFRIYMRANDAFTQYAGFEVGNNQARLVYNTGFGDRYFSALTEIDHTTEWTANTTWYAYAGGNVNNVSERMFSLYKEGLPVMSVTDAGFYTALGPANRGWGFGLQNSLFLLGQSMSPTVEQIYVSDMAWPYEPATVVPCNLNSTGPLTGDTTLYVRGEASHIAPPMGVDGDGPIAFSSRMPRLYAMVVPIE